MQQSVWSMHGPPCGLHIMRPQKPFLQMSSQQSLGCPQAMPFAPHCVPPQNPFAHAMPPQHESPAMHALPFGTHWVPPQNPFTQSSAQQSTVFVQARPSAEQLLVFTHVPVSHDAPAQQALESEQELPTGLHVDVGFPRSLLAPQATKPSAANASARLASRMARATRSRIPRSYERNVESDRKRQRSIV